MKNTRTVMSKSLRKDMDQDPLKDICVLKGYKNHVCGGRITREHAMYYAGKKIQERWAIIFLCAAGHGVDEFQDADTEVSKDIRQWVALNQANDSDLLKFSKATPSFFFERDRLNKKYGVYNPPTPPLPVAGINY